jgi:hypothetical protein
MCASCAQLLHSLGGLVVGRKAEVPTIMVAWNNNVVSGKPSLGMFMKICLWEGVAPRDHPAIRQALDLVRVGHFSRAQVVGARIGLQIRAW